MSATLRLKQLLFIAAALALVSLGFVAAISTASPARADDTPPCVPTDDQVVTDWFETDPGAPWVATGKNRVKTEGTDATYTDWVNEGAPVRTETNVAPSADGDLVRYVPAGTVDDSTEGHWDNTVITFYTWTGGNSGVAPPVYADETETSLHPNWNPTNGNPQGGPHGSASLYSPYEAGNGPNTASWFLKAGSFVPGVEDTDHLWQKQVRTLVPGMDDVIEYEYTKTIEGVDCPPVDNGKQVVVCKYVGTPPGTLHHIIIVSESSLTNPANNTGYVAPPDGDSWTDAQGQTTEGSVAVRYAEPGEQANTLDLEEECGGGETPPEECEPEDYNGEAEGCGTPPEECVPEDYNGQEPGCGEPPVECPDGDHNGQEPGCDEVDPGPDTCPVDSDKPGAEIPADKTEEEFCDEDDEENVCPDDTDHAGEEVPEGESEEKFCDDDDVDPGPNCEEDPTQPRCDEDKPPVVVPDDGTTPNSPSNGPTVKGASATAPTVVAGQAAGTPAAQVPTAVNAGLGSTQQELAGNGGPLGILGIATALLGAALVGLTLRPKRRIGAALRART